MRIPPSTHLAAVLALLAPAACDRPDPAAAVPDTRMVPTVTSPATSGATAASTPVASGADASQPVARPADASAAAAPVACGDAPRPPCPLFAWMKANAGPAGGHADADPATLANVLDKVAAFAPPGYPNWISISRDGAAAARAGQGDAAKASCRGCHTQYKAKYKAEIRSRPLS